MAIPTSAFLNQPNNMCLPCLFLLGLFIPTMLAADSPPRLEPALSLQKAVDHAVAETVRDFAQRGLKPDQLAVTLLDLHDPATLPAGSHRGTVPIYPASVIKLFYLAAAHQWLEEGKITDTPGAFRDGGAGEPMGLIIRIAGGGERVALEQFEHLAAALRGNGLAADDRGEESRGGVGSQGVAIRIFLAEEGAFAAVRAFAPGFLAGVDMLVAESLLRRNCL